MISPATDTAAGAAAPRRLGVALLLSLACHLPLLWLQLGSPEGAKQAPSLQLELRADPAAARPLPPLPPPTAAEFATERPTAATAPPGAQAPPPPPPPTNAGLSVIAVESEQPATVLPPALVASQVRTRTEPLAALNLAASAPSLAALPSQLPEKAEPAESSEAQAAERQAREAQRLAEAERQAQARELAAKQERERGEAERLAQQQAQELAERQQAAQREAARQAAERAAAEQAAAERAEAVRQQAARDEAARREAERLEAERLEVERQERARQAAAQDAAQAAAREAAARAEAARLKAAERAADDERREAARRAMGRQLDAEAAQREAEAAAARQGQAGPRGALPHAWSTARRYRLYGRSDPNPEIQQYAEAWARKIHLNTPVELVRELAAQPHQAPLVTVAIRRDGTVEAVTLVNRSGVAAVDDAVRRIVQMHQPFQAFAPGMAADFDVIEIRRSWHFNPTAVWLQ